MVIFHSYVSLPEGKWQRMFGERLERCFEIRSDPPKQVIFLCCLRIALANHNNAPPGME